jgi:dTMP kinase
VSGSAPTRSSGLFVAFEGPEGAGKSSQILRLAQRLRAEGFDPVVTREPGGSPAGDRVRALLLDPSLTLDPLSELLLYAAGRAQHVAELIAPALAAGRLVLTDRFSAATVAYQGYGRQLDLAFVEALNERVTLGHRPDLTVLLDLPPQVGLARVAARGAADRLERAALDFHRRVREGFLAQAAAAPERWTVVDAGRDPEAVAQAVWAAVTKPLRDWAAPW